MIETRGTLDALGLKHGADKASNAHDYLRRYEPFLFPLRESCKRVLEIGIGGSASLRTWRDYFLTATIYGLDHNAEYVKAALGQERIVPIFGEATDPETWRKLATELPGLLDLVVDDGGHFSSQIIPAFTHAYPLLRPGGIYIVEDLHQIYKMEVPKGNSGFSSPSLSQTAFAYFAGLIDVMNDYGSDQTGKRGAVDGSPEFVHFSKSFVLIKKPYVCSYP